ncbi:hypothetical protein [Halomonas sp. C05BenzN]|uniref:hypothetical protein n=1 Tax=Halomonas sp. C05BenzN TaxID=3411041 RepID=UPI003B92D0A0
MSADLNGHQLELLARILQHGGVLASPFGHPGEDSLLREVLDDIDDLEARGLIEVKRDRSHDAPRQLELTETGYAALGAE